MKAYHEVLMLGNIKEQAQIISNMIKVLHASRDTCNTAEKVKYEDAVIHAELCRDAITELIKLL